MQRREMLQLTGTAVAASVGVGNGAAKTRSRTFQEGTSPISFESSEDLLLEASLLPGDGWEQEAVGEDALLDASVLFYREFTDAGDNFWAVRSAVAGRENEAEAVALYEELSTQYLGLIGQARIMDLDLATEAVIAGYDGRTIALFRDVNCVGSVGFTDCTTQFGCLSDVGQTEELARTKRQLWRGELEAPTATEAGQQGTEEATPTTESSSEFVDEIDEQVTLPYGETARLSNGVETTVYQGTLYDQMGDEVPENRDRFLVVPVEAQNTANEPRIIPDQTDSWEVVFGDQQLTNVFRYGALAAGGYEAFEGGDVQGGVRREGVLLFEVDSGLQAQEFDVLWQDEWWVAADLEGSIDVRWSADG
ncbi:hypothetical protein OB920_18555 [Halobacteria archaeon HArc-gm2]|nr:hypothetical protein [Halobacteria archaeon HArc-gm2]